MPGLQSALDRAATCCGLHARLELSAPSSKATGMVFTPDMNTALDFVIKKYCLLPEVVMQEVPPARHLLVYASHMCLQDWTTSLTDELLLPDHVGPVTQVRMQAPIVLQLLSPMHVAHMPWCCQLTHISGISVLRASARSIRLDVTQTADCLCDCSSFQKSVQPAMSWPEVTSL